MDMMRGDNMDINKIKKLIKEQMIEELKYGDSDIIGCDNILDDDLFSEISPEEQSKLADMIYDEWRNYANKIEEFLKTVD